MEIVYLLTNPTMPNLVKIGKTSDLEMRLKDLSRHSGVPVPFECFYACEVEDSSKVEKALHDAFGDHRINPKREFFRLNPERVIAILKLFEKRNILLDEEIAENQEELIALHKEQSRREQFRFSLVDVPVGAILKFSKDENHIAKVIDDRKIEFEGQVTSLSAAANVLLYRMGWNIKAVQGPLYWTFEGETLVERRLRLEESEDN